MAGAGHNGRLYCIALFVDRVSLVFFLFVFFFFAIYFDVQKYANDRSSGERPFLMLKFALSRSSVKKAYTCTFRCTLFARHMYIFAATCVVVINTDSNWAIHNTPHTIYVCVVYEESMIGNNGEHSKATWCLCKGARNFFDKTGATFCSGDFEICTQMTRALERPFIAVGCRPNYTISAVDEEICAEW